MEMAMYRSFWMQVSEAALTTLQECREKQFKGCSTQFQTLEVKWSIFQSRNWKSLILSGPGRHQPLLVGLSWCLPPSSWKGQDSHPGARASYKGKIMLARIGYKWRVVLKSEETKLNYTFTVVKGVNPSLELLSPSSSIVLETTLEHSGLASLAPSKVLGSQPVGGFRKGK